MNFVQQYCEKHIDPEIRDLSHYINEHRILYPKNIESLNEFISTIEKHIKRLKRHRTKIENLKDY